MERKGITPVIATVLLIAISVAAIGASAAFLTDLVGDIKEGIEDKLSEKEKREKSEIAIIYGYEDGGDIIIDVRNQGSISLKAANSNNQRIWNLYVDGQPQNNWVLQGSSSINGPIIIDPKETKRIDTNVAYPSSGSKTIEIQGQYEVSSAIVCDSSGNRC